MFNSKPRRENVNWSSNYDTTPSAFNVDLLEDSSNNYIWQPQTLMYNDVITGEEVWKLSDTPGLRTYYHNDIALNPWSADGKRISFASDRHTNAYEEQYVPKKMVVNSDGSYFRPMINVSNRGQGYTTWSPVVPDVYYDTYTISNRHWSEPKFPTSDLYKMHVNNVNETSELFLSFPVDKTFLSLKKSISGDGTKVMVFGQNESWFLPATVYPETQASVNDPNGYSANLSSFDLYWGNMRIIIGAFFIRYWGTPWIINPPCSQSI